jgi:DNA-binding NarL/FixJ family response regulator
MLLANEEIHRYMLSLCRENNYKYLVAINPEELVKPIKKQKNAIVFVDYETVKIYGARIYSRVKVACPECNIILLSDQEHQGLIKEAMELGAYACIMSPYEEWEVLTMIRNILAKKKLKKQKKLLNNERV